MWDAPALLITKCTGHRPERTNPQEQIPPAQATMIQRRKKERCFHDVSDEEPHRKPTHYSQWYRNPRNSCQYPGLSGRNDAFHVRIWSFGRTGMIGKKATLGTIRKTTVHACIFRLFALLVSAAENWPAYPAVDRLPVSFAIQAARFGEASPSK